MASVSFTATCIAYYKSSLEIPEKLAKEGDYKKIAKYCREHIAEAEVEDGLEWLCDTEDCVTEEDIRYVCTD